MNIAYCSLLLPEEKKIAERSKERLSGISIHKVSTAEIKGIDENLGKPVDIFNIINTINFPKFPQLIFKTENWNHSNEDGHKDYHIGYINLFGIKYISQYWGQYHHLLKWVKQCKGNCIICIHHIYLPSMMAAVKLGKRYQNKVKLCLNTGDVPGNYGLQGQYRKNIKQLLTEKIVDCNIIKLAKKFDCFIFVTKDMVKAFGVEDKPYTVVECAYIQPDYAKNMKIIDSKIKTIFYAGAIRKEYGIEHLLKAFSLIKEPEYRLFIAGGGADEKLVKSYEENDNRIKLLGFITPQEVLKYQLSSHVLVSPRQSNYKFVKYSFPSKAVDSLASGIPYVAHKLPCDPPEYADYINYPYDESDEALKDKLIEICNLSFAERKAIGEKARKFILEEKNPIAITKGIVCMWENILER
ncbi:MAG: glycosyltransferase family 4 protein [Lachnospiraceae bacterium]|nr:glycosyltransferase family 4 protein [uncultured Acetatifactor sp.]MCI8287948.1 glycosyltransferase family 4 protein [Lachnospiraceae bacterium]